MEKEYAKDYPIPFHNDVFFKYMLIGDDVGSALLRSRIIEEIYGLKVHETKVLNPELLPEAFFGKRAVLDVVLEDEAGHFYEGTAAFSAVWLPPGRKTAEAGRRIYRAEAVLSDYLYE